MEYYKFSAGRGYEYVRLDRAGMTAWYFDDLDLEWVEQPAYFTEIISNGGGVPMTESEALDAVGHLQSA
ncbi:MAG: hypothetical protein QM655_02155 [Nocardioidaceae bacterium]